jgi:hypothetical protein
MNDRDTQAEPDMPTTPNASCRRPSERARAHARQTSMAAGLCAICSIFSMATMAADAENHDVPPGPGLRAGPLTITFGGFVELATIYRNRNETADVSSNFNTGIPFPNSSQYHLSEFRESARQSRLSILTQGPQDRNASAEAYFEMDFQSSAPTANSLESNSYNPRMRQVYAVYRRAAERFYLAAYERDSSSNRRGLARVGGLFGASELQRLNGIVILKTFGMTLAQIRPLLRTRPPPLVHVPNGIQTPRWWGLLSC